ncbi:MAG: hypothetical protein IJH63_10485 [Methanobrevibacter sp.]|nr:hypothetical protein [Methanosphaera sp.]MBR0371127.1 hypothetical protein [Methanobrevibacter sp.]
MTGLIKVAEHIPTTEEKNRISEYYHHISLNATGKKYQVRNKDEKYLGTIDTIMEALHYRDLYYNTSVDEAPRPNKVNLKKDNPYINNGLLYPVPERLRKGRPKRKGYGEGTILKKSKSCYGVYYNSTWVCSCRTYEQAYYYRQELIKGGWDKTQLPVIENSYPEWYTELLYFYQYIVRDRNYNNWQIKIPKKYTVENKLDVINYNNIEDALYERDFLIKYDWDYNLLVEIIDDTKNPYYNMKLPPFPERKKVRNICKKNSREKEILEMIHIINDDPNINQTNTARKLGTTPQNIRNWLGKYGVDWMEFKRIIFSGKDPLTVLQFKPVIYNPDLEPSKKFNNYIYKTNGRKKAYRVQRKVDGKSINYGSYKNRRMAEKVVRELKKVDWNKNELPRIKKELNEPSPDRYVYYSNQNDSYMISKSFKGRKIFYGRFKTRELARRVRDLLEEHDWDKSLVPEFRLQAENEGII